MALIGLVALVLIWSFAWLAMKLASQFSGPFTFSALRYIVGTVALFLWLIVRRVSLRPTPLLPTAVIGICQTAAFQALVQAALVSGGAGKVSLLAYTMPFWVVPLAWWWTDEKPGLGRWICILIAAAGFICIVEPWHGLGSTRSVFLAIAGGLAWACGVVVAKRAFQRDPDLGLLRLTAWQMLIGTVALVVIMFSVHERPTVWSLTMTLAVLYTGVFASAVGWVLWTLLVRQLPASVAGLTSLAVPVCVVILALVFLHEVPSGIEWFGIALIAASLAALNFLPRQDQASPARS